MAVRVDIRLRSIEDYIKKTNRRARITTPREEMAIELYADRMIDHIKQGWPVDTGTSRDRWQYELKISTGDIRIVIENPMYYAEYVHRKGGSPEDPLWQRLVPEAFNMHKDQMLIAVRAEVDKTQRAIERKKRQGERPRAGLLDLIRNPNLADVIGGLFGVQ